MQVIRGTFAVEIQFGANGNGKSFTIDGWSRPEREYTVNSGHEARLVLPKPFDADMYELLVDVWPFVVPDRLPVQRIETIVRGTLVMRAAVDSRDRRVMGCEIPCQAVEGCESVDITFRFPDAVAPASVTDSPDVRVIAFAFFSVRFSGRQLRVNPSNCLILA